MRTIACSYCNGEGRIRVVREEALERALSDFLQLYNEPPKIDYYPCPGCAGKGTTSEIELRDLCQVQYL